MRYGLTLPSTVDGVREIAPLVERLGFDYLACGEHVTGAGESHNGLVTLSYAAALTTRIELLTAVTLAPLYPAALVAKQTAVLDVLSGGRLNVGVGVGGENPGEFEACGVPLAGRGRRASEAIEVMRALWTGAPVDIDGEFTSIHGERLTPAPRRVPPVWVSGRSEPAMRRAARHGDVWFPYLMSPERFARSWARVAELSDESPPDPWVHLTVAVGTDPAEARRTGEAVTRAAYGDDTPARYLIAGSPDTCQARIAEYAAAGAVGAVFSPRVCRQGVRADGNPAG